MHRRFNYDSMTIRDYFQYQRALEHNDLSHVVSVIAHVDSAIYGVPLSDIMEAITEFNTGLVEYCVKWMPVHAQPDADRLLNQALEENLP